MFEAPMICYNFHNTNSANVQWMVVNAKPSSWAGNP